MRERERERERGGRWKKSKDLSDEEKRQRGRVMRGRMSIREKDEEGRVVRGS